MSRKKTNNTAMVVTDQTADTNLPQDGATSIGSGVTTIPSGENGSDGTNSGTANGGAPSSEPEVLVELASRLGRTGCSDVEDLIKMAGHGRSLVTAIDAYEVLHGPLKGMPATEDPVEIVGALVDLVSALQSQLAAAAHISDIPAVIVAAEETEKRSFAVFSRVRLDNRLIKPPGGVLVTREQHASLASTGTVDPDWDEGI